MRGISEGTARETLKEYPWVVEDMKPEDVEGLISMLIKGV